MSKHPLSNVVSIADRLPSEAHISAKQSTVRDVIRAAADTPIDDVPVAVVAVAITPHGSVRTTAIMVEPDHVPEIVAALQKLSIDLTNFARANSKVAVIATAALSIAIGDSLIFPAYAR